MTHMAPSRLEVMDVSKSFGPTQALARASLSLRPGEIHTILGENGSGKSTLVKLLAGVYRPDVGGISIDGIEYNALRSPREARKHGIATVFQEVLTVGPQSVLENVWLGIDGAIRHGGPRSDRRERASRVLRSLVELPLDLDAPAENLSLSDRQAVCVARAIVAEPKVLILDESTASLDIGTRDRLFEVLRELASRGTSVLFISHRMDEIDQISDRITVLRSGATVASALSRKHTSTNELLLLMTGGSGLVDAEDKATKVFGPPRLRVSGLSLRPKAAKIDVVVKAGELLGVAGLEGQGQESFLLALAGIAASGGAATIHNVGSSGSTVDPKSIHRLPIAYLPRDRRGDAIFPDMSIRENFALPTSRDDRRAGLLSFKRASQRFLPYLADLRIKLRNDSDPISGLSGGNQQKVIVARWLASKPDVLVLNDPTRGVDIGAKRDLYRELEKLCAAGMSVVMLSSEMDELIELMDRVLVFREHEIFAELAGTELTRSNLVSAYFGHHSESRTS